MEGNETTQENVVFVEWDKISTLLNSTKRVTNEYHQLFRWRANIEHDYAESLRKWSAYIHHKLEKGGTPLYFSRDGEPSRVFSCGVQHLISEDSRLQEALVALCDQADCEASLHRNRYQQLTAEGGPLETLEELHASYSTPFTGSKKLQRKLVPETGMIRNFRKKYATSFGILKDELKVIDASTKEFIKHRERQRELHEKLTDPERVVAPIPANHLKTKIIGVDGKAEVARSRHDQTVARLRRDNHRHTQGAKLYMDELVRQEMYRLDTIKRQIMFLVDKINPSNNYIKTNENAIRNIQNKLRLFEPKGVAINWAKENLIYLPIPGPLTTLEDALGRSCAEPGCSTPLQDEGNTWSPRSTSHYREPQPAIVGPTRKSPARPLSSPGKPSPPPGEHPDTPPGHTHGNPPVHPPGKPPPPPGEDPDTPVPSPEPSPDKSSSNPGATQDTREKSKQSRTLPTDEPRDRSTGDRSESGGGSDQILGSEAPSTASAPAPVPERSDPSSRGEQPSEPGRKIKAYPTKEKPVDGPRDHGRDPQDLGGLAPDPPPVMIGRIPGRPPLLNGGGWDCRSPVSQEPAAPHQASAVRTRHAANFCGRQKKSEKRLDEMFTTSRISKHDTSQDEKSCQQENGESKRSPSNSCHDTYKVPDEFRHYWQKSACAADIDGVKQNGGSGNDLIVENIENDAFTKDGEDLENNTRKNEKSCPYTTAQLSNGQLKKIQLPKTAWQSVNDVIQTNAVVYYQALRDAASNSDDVLRSDVKLTSHEAVLTSLELDGDSTDEVMTSEPPTKVETFSETNFKKCEKYSEGWNSKNEDGLTSTCSSEVRPGCKEEQKKEEERRNKEYSVTSDRNLYNN